jgi:hypothetical protein
VAWRQVGCAEQYGLARGGKDGNDGGGQEKDSGEEGSGEVCQQQENGRGEEQQDFASRGKHSQACGVEGADCAQY